MKSSNKYAIRFPDIRNLECTLYHENEVKWVEHWERQMHSHCISPTSNTKRDSKVIDRQLAEVVTSIGRVEPMLATVRLINYKHHCLDIENCSKYYEEQVDKIESIICNALTTIEKRLKAAEQELKKMITSHIQRLEDKSRRFCYGRKAINDKNLQIIQMEQKIKSLKKTEQTTQDILEKYYNFNLGLGYNIKKEGLIWVMRKIGSPCSYDSLPKFLTNNEKTFLIQRHTNQIKKQNLIEERASLVQRSHELRNIDLGKSVNTFGKINDRSIMSQRIQANVNESMQMVSMNKQRMRGLLLDSTTINATPHQLVYKQASRKIAHYYTNRNVSQLNLRRSSIAKRKIQRRRQAELQIHQIDIRIKAIDDWLAEQSRCILSAIRKEFEGSEQQILIQGRAPTAVLGALFGWETAARECGRLCQVVLQYVNS